VRQWERGSQTRKGRAGRPTFPYRVSRYTITRGRIMEDLKEKTKSQPREFWEFGGVT